MTALPSRTPGGERRVNIVQGEQHVAGDPDVVLTTLLGSCVAACLRDPVAGIGGMNHFLLPGDMPGAEPTTRSGNAVRHGVHAMELLMNELLCHGAQRSRLEAKLFGGACIMKGLTDVGRFNASFAERFLKDEGITIVASSLRGIYGRRIQFWPVSGRARQIMLNAEHDDVLRGERFAPVAPVATPSGSMELF